MAPALFAAFLVVFKQAGFGLMTTGLCRAKNAAHSMALHLLVLPIALLAFFAVGFAWLGDDPGRLSSHWTILHGHGYFLQADRNHPTVLAWFLLTGGYAAVAAAIPTGALAERWSLKSFVCFVALIGAILFPALGCWLFAGGWLSQLGHKAGLAHGAIDYAGSCAVHLLGGTLAFVAAWYIRPRIGKYDEAGRPRPILGHNVPMVMLGTLVLAFGWFGFTTGRSFLLGDGRAALIAINTLLAGSGGAVAAAAYMWLRYGRPDPSLTCNGLLAGLVAICAGCAMVSPWAALLIGIVGGVVAVWGVLLCERGGLDDPVGASSVHGLGGVWGMVAVGLLADGTYASPFNGIAGPVRGLFYGGGFSPLFCQLIAVGACIVWAAIAGGAAFVLLDRLLGSNRVPPEVEMAGLDIPEMGAPGYPEFISHVAPESASSGYAFSPGMM